MTELNWEYCELRLTSRPEFSGLLLSIDGYSYNCFIRYYVLDENHIDIQLSEIGKKLSYNPFIRAMAFLGANGWEIVTLQMGNAHGGSTTHDADVLAWGNRIALLKRPIVSGRKINEPALKL
jgi:hypothetical protein